jgi:hypothetical protein
MARIVVRRSVSGTWSSFIDYPGTDNRPAVIVSGVSKADLHKAIRAYLGLEARDPRPAKPPTILTGG